MMFVQMCAGRVLVEEHPSAHLFVLIRSKRRYVWAVNDTNVSRRGRCDLDTIGVSR